MKITKEQFETLKKITRITCEEDTKYIKLLKIDKEECRDDFMKWLNDYSELYSIIHSSPGLDIYFYVFDFGNQKTYIHYYSY